MHAYTHTQICTPTYVHMHIVHMHTHTHICTQHGGTALYFAAFNGHEDVTGLLLGAGPDPDLTYKVIRLNLTCI